LDRFRDARIQGNLVKVFKLIYNNFYFKIAWAPSKGIKDKLKNNWNVDIGCTYVPWGELNNIDINFVNLSDGAFID
jgi:hypothetical protein